MPPWLGHPHVLYVLAAYGVAAMVLLGLLFGSWRGWRYRRAEWKKLRAQGVRR